MKKIGFIVLCFSFHLIVNSQDRPNDNFEFRLGLAIHNQVFHDKYYDYKYNIDTEIDMINGFNLEIAIPSKFSYIKFIAGLIYEKYSLEPNSWSYPSTNVFEHSLNGGGLYLGINPNVGNKYIGISASLNLGYFSYKNTITYINNELQNSDINIHDIYSTGGLGASSTLGLYIRYWKIGINPSLSLILSGNKSTNFIFSGIIVPFTIYFE
jgi:hypothetical protein